MYEPHRPYPLATLLVLCLALCADSALAGATGGWGDGAPPAKPDTIKVWTFQRKDRTTAYYLNHQDAMNAYLADSGGGNLSGCKFFEDGYAYACNKDTGGSLWVRVISNTGCPRNVPLVSGNQCVAACPEKHTNHAGQCIKDIESGGGGDFGGGGASDGWEEDPKKPDEDPKDPEEPKDPDPDFGDLGDIPKPPVPPPTPPASGPNVNVGVGVNVPEPCTGAAAGTVGCMKPGEPTGEKPKTKDVKVPTQAERPVSNIKGCPDPKYFDLWDQRYELSYDQFCAQAPLIKPYVIFSATLAAFFITLSAFRRK